MRFVYAIVVGAAALLPASLTAQHKNAQPEIDLAITYSAQHGDQTSDEGFWAQGGGAELTATFYHGLGIAANVTGTHAANISSSGVGLTLVTTTFGPTYTWVPRRESQKQLRLLGESLIGIANGAGSVFPDPSGAQSDASSLALHLGGGADLNLSRHFAARLLHADWLRTQLPNASTNVQNTLQLDTGIIFRFPQ